MSLVTITTKLPKEQVNVLTALSNRTKIPKSELIREGVRLVVQRYKEDIVTPELRREIEFLLCEDKKLLERLSKE